MDSDLDPFGDLLPEPPFNPARIGGKFQPRAKPPPRKIIASNANEKSVSVASSALVLNRGHLGNNDENTVHEPVNCSTQLVAPDGDNGDASLMPTVVASLGLESDPFADTIIAPSTVNARAGGKFKPIAKAQPRKGVSGASNVAISCNTMEEPASLASTTSANLQSSEFVDVGGRLTDPVNSSITTLENLIGDEPTRNEDHKNSGVALPSDPHSGLGNPIGENVNILLGLEYIEDFVTQSPSSAEFPLPNDEVDAARQCRFPSQKSANSSALVPCKMAILDPVTCNESVVQADDGRRESEESRPFLNMDKPEVLSKSTIASDSCTSIFQPNPKLESSKEKPSVSNLSPDAVGSIAPTTNMQFAPSETVYNNEVSISAFPSDEVLDYSPMSFSNCIPPNATSSKLPVNEEQINLTQAPRASDIAHQEDLSGLLPKESCKSKRRDSCSVSNPSQKSKQSTVAGERNEGDKSSRCLRKRTAGLQLIDETEDEAHENDGFSSEALGTSIADEDNDYDYREDEGNDSEDREEITSPRTRASKNSEKFAAEKNGPVKRRKTDNNVQENSTQRPPKKFPHSTRRKNRLKDLLSMPEEEIDFQRLPVRDIILLAGYKEQLAVKQAKVSKNTSTNQRTSNSIHGEESLNGEDTVASEQDGGYAEDQSNSLFNHHSFMDKTPTARWSKQDTELFYEGIRQFGTDLSMIQQLFPDKTRHHIKLKYKKEERQHPLRLYEALSSRAKDHSYFEKVIEQLQQVAARADQEANREDSVGVTNEETGLNRETNEEIAKSERDEDRAVEDNEGEVGGVHSPKYDEEEDDMDVWSSYQSVF